MPDRKFITTKELAKALGCDPRTIRRAAQSGQIPAARPGRNLRFDPQAVKVALSNAAKKN
jgi:excisionase family DNA binding protein